MKFLVAVLLISNVSFAAPNGKSRILPVTKEQEAVKKEQAASEKLKALGIKEEDCDEKAKKPVEIKPEAISLTGNAGCSLDEAQ